MSPILVRPVREQLEHDRVIRLLPQELAPLKLEVAINPGAEQNAAVGGASRKEYPDAVLYSTDKGRRLVGVVEVETGESVNNLEAMAQWAHLAKLKVPFRLYVPMGSVDVARRLSADNQIPIAEIWSYHHVGDQLRFTLVHRDATAAALPAGAASKGASPKAAARRPAPAKPAAKAAPKAATKASSKRVVNNRAAAAKAPVRKAAKAPRTAPATRRPARAASKAAKSTAANGRRPARKAGGRPSARSAKRK